MIRIKSTLAEQTKINLSVKFDFKNKERKKSLLPLERDEFHLKLNPEDEKNLICIIH